MDKFIEQHADRISRSLGCFDRVLFRGYLPVMSGAAMAAFLKSREVWGETLKSFLLEQAERLKRHALDLCTQTNRPYEYESGVYSGRRGQDVRPLALHRFYDGRPRNESADSVRRSREFLDSPKPRPGADLGNRNRRGAKGGL